ncbi:MAG: SPASM domain-containing protein [Thermodesulfobacteriota bacterium]
MHPRFGDLNRKDAVVMGQGEGNGFEVAEENPYYIHLSVTGRCYARCRGCVNSNVTAFFEGDRKDFVPIADTLPERDAACILNLARENGPGRIVVCFYGGEPFLATEKMDRVYQLLNRSERGSRFQYMVYTSGELLKSALTDFPELIRNIWLYAVSIDGSREQHEQSRPGTHLEKIHSSLSALKHVRRGSVLMWSTLREEQSLGDCFQEFMFLKSRGYADQFFWHWVEAGEPFQEFEGYLQRYEKELSAIMDVYMDWLRRGRILPIAHVNELIVYLLAGKKRNASACGVERAMNYDLIDGKIHSCADLPAELAIGRIKADGTPVVNTDNLSFLVDYKKDLGCYDCGVHDYCGGRCPVQAFTSGHLRMVQYCQLMRLHVGTVKTYLEDIVAALDNNNLNLQDVYDQSAFYAQFTDVTP